MRDHPCAKVGEFAYGQLPHSTGHRSIGAGQFSALRSNETPTGAPFGFTKGNEHRARTQVEQAPFIERRIDRPKKMLSPQSELLQERAIAAEIFRLEIVEKATSLAYDLE